MLFPVEVTVQWPEEVVEVRELVSHLGNDRQGFMELLRLVVGGTGELLLQGILLMQDADRFRQLGGLPQEVLRAIHLVLEVLKLADTLLTDLKCDRTVVEWAPQWPGDGLQLSNAGYVHDALGHL